MLHAVWCCLLLCLVCRWLVFGLLCVASRVVRVVFCLLRIVCCALCVACCSLCVVGCALFVVCCVWFAVCLIVVCGLLNDDRRVLSFVCYVLGVVR